MDVFQENERKAIKRDLEFFFLGHEIADTDSETPTRKSSSTSNRTISLAKAEGDTGASLQIEFNRLRGIVSDSAITIINRQRDIIRLLHRFRVLVSQTIEQVVAHWVLDEVTRIPPTLEVAGLLIYVLGNVPLGTALVCEHEDPLKVAHREVQTRCDAASLAHLDATVQIPLCASVHFAGFDFFVEACVGFTKDTQIGGAIRPPADQFRLQASGEGSQHVTKQTEFITRAIGLPFGLRSRGTNSNAYLPSETRIEYGPDGDYYVRSLCRSRPPLLEVSKTAAKLSPSHMEKQQVATSPEAAPTEEASVDKKELAAFVNQTQTHAGSYPPPWANAPSAQCHRLRERSEYRLLPTLLLKYAPALAPDSWMGRHPSALIEGEVLEVNRVLHEYAVPKLANYFLLMDRIRLVYSGADHNTTSPVNSIHLAEVRKADSLRLLFSQAMEDGKLRNATEASNNKLFTDLLLLSSSSEQFGLTCQRVKSVFHHFGVNLRLLGRVIELVENALVLELRLVNRELYVAEAHRNNAIVTAVADNASAFYAQHPILRTLRAKMAARAATSVLRSQWKEAIATYFADKYEECESGGYQRKKKQPPQQNPHDGVPITKPSEKAPSSRRQRGTISFENPSIVSQSTATSLPFDASLRQIQNRPSAEASAVINQFLSKDTLDTLVNISGDYLTALNGTDEALWQSKIIPMIEHKFGYKWIYYREYQSESNVLDGVKNGLSTGSRLRVRHIPQSDTEKWVKTNKCPAPKPVSLCEVPADSWGYRQATDGDALSNYRQTASTATVDGNNSKSLVSPRDERLKYLTASSAPKGPVALEYVSTADLVDQALEDAHAEYIDAFEFVAEPNTPEGLPKVPVTDGLKGIRIGHRQDYRIVERICALCGIKLSTSGHSSTATGITLQLSPALKSLTIEPFYSACELKMIANGLVEPIIGACKDEIRATRKLWGSTAEYRQLPCYYKMSELYRLQSKFVQSAEMCKKFCDILTHDNGNNLVGLIDANLRTARVLVSARDAKSALSHAQYAVTLATEHTGHNSQLLTRSLLALLNLYESIEGNVSENFTKKKIELAMKLQPLCMGENVSVPVARIEAKAALLQLQHAIQTLTQREVDNIEIAQEIKAHAALLEAEAQEAAKAKDNGGVMSGAGRRTSLASKRPASTTTPNEVKIKEPRKLFRLSAFRADISEAEGSLASSISDVLRTQSIDDELIYFMVRYACQTKNITLLPVLCSTLSTYVHISSPHFSKIVEEITQLLFESIHQLSIDVVIAEKEVEVKRRRAVATSSKTFSLRPSLSIRNPKQKGAMMEPTQSSVDAVPPLTSTLAPTLATFYSLFSDPKWSDESIYDLRALADELKSIAGVGGLGTKLTGAQAFSDSLNRLTEQRSSMWKSMRDLHENNRKIESKRTKKLLRPDYQSESEGSTDEEHEGHRYQVPAKTFSRSEKSESASAGVASPMVSDTEAFGATVVLVDDEDETADGKRRASASTSSFVAPSAPALPLPLREQILTTSTVCLMRRWLRSIMRSVPVDLTEQPWEWDKKVVVSPYCTFVTRVFELCETSPTIGLRCCLAICDELEMRPGQLQRQQQQITAINRSIPSLRSPNAVHSQLSSPRTPFLSSRSRSNHLDDSAHNASIASMLEDIGVSNDNPLHHEPWPLQPNQSQTRYSPLAAPFLHKIVLLMWGASLREMVVGGHLDAPIQSAFVADIDPRRLPRFELTKQFFVFTRALQNLLQCLRGIYGMHVAEHVTAPATERDLFSSDSGGTQPVSTPSPLSQLEESPTQIINSPIGSDDKVVFSSSVPHCIQTLMDHLFNGIAIVMNDHQLSNNVMGSQKTIPPNRSKSIDSSKQRSSSSPIGIASPKLSSIKSVQLERRLYVIGLPQGLLARLQLIPTGLASARSLGTSPRLGQSLTNPKTANLDLSGESSGIAAASTVISHHPMLESSIKATQRIPSPLVLAYEYPFHLIFHSLKRKVLDGVPAVVDALGVRYPLQMSELWEHVAEFLTLILEEEQRLYVPRYCRSEVDRRIAQHYELYHTANAVTVVGRVALGSLKGQGALEELKVQYARALLGDRDSGSGGSKLRDAFRAQRTKLVEVSDYNISAPFDPNSLPHDVTEEEVTEVEERGLLIGRRNKAFGDVVRSLWRKKCDKLISDVKSAIAIEQQSLSGSNVQVSNRQQLVTLPESVFDANLPQTGQIYSPIRSSVLAPSLKILAPLSPQRVAQKRATFAPTLDCKLVAISHQSHVKALSPTSLQLPSTGAAMSPPHKSSPATWPIGLRVTNAIKPADKASASSSLQVPQRQMLLAMSNWGGEAEDVAIIPMGSATLEVEWRLASSAPPMSALLAVFPCVEEVKARPLTGPPQMVPPYEYNLRNATATLKGLSVRKALGSASLPCPSTTGKFVVALFHQGTKPVLVSEPILVT